MDKKALQDLYLEYLRDEGYKGELDEDGDISFKYEGGFYYIFIDEDDEKYFRIVYPNFWEIESDDERIKALTVTNTVNREYKCGKVLLVGKDDKKNTWAEVGVFLSDANEFKLFFTRMIGIIQSMVSDYEQGMKS